MQNFFAICSQGFSWQYVSTGSDNGFQWGVNKLFSYTTGREYRRE